MHWAEPNWTSIGFDKKKKPDCDEAIGFQKQTMENQMWQS